jgi:hypothetical protein
MNDKRTYIRYAGDGGLYLWDNECGIQWHNMESGNKTDWLLFFDICREQPSPYTEPIITAIMNGLCPHKDKAIKRVTWRGAGGQQGVDWKYVKFWYLRENKKGFGPNSVPEFTRKPATHFFLRAGRIPEEYYSGPILVPMAETFTPYQRRFRERSWKVHKFDNFLQGWRFLFQFM